MLQFIFKLILAFLAFQVLGSFVRLFRGSPAKKPRNTTRKQRSERAKKPDYSDLTPYDIEDADYEELPRKD